MKTTKNEDDQNGRGPKWKTTKMEDDQNRRGPYRRPQNKDDHTNEEDLNKNDLLQIIRVRACHWRHQTCKIFILSTFEPFLVKNKKYTKF